MDEKQQARLFVADALELDRRGLYKEATEKYVQSLGRLMSLIPDEGQNEFVALTRACVDRLQTVREAEATDIADLLSTPSFSSSRENSASSSSASALPLPEIRIPSLSSKKKLSAESATLRKSVSVTASLEASRRKHERALLAQHRARQVRLLAENTAAKAQQAYQELLSSRQRFYTRINERVQEFVGSVAGLTREWAADHRYRSETERWSRAVQECLRQSAGDPEPGVITPILGLLESPTHPVAAITRDFFRRQRAQLDQVMRVIEECRLFEHHLVNVLQSNFIGSADENAALGARLSIEHFLFSGTSLGNGLLAGLHAMNAPRQASFDRLLVDLGWEGILARLRVSRRYIRDDDSFPLHSLGGTLSLAIGELRLLPGCSTPYEKLMCFVRTCSLLCDAIELGSTPSDTMPLLPEGIATAVPPLEESIGGEDLLRLYAYAVVRSAVPTLLTDLQFVNEFCPEALLRGEAGYVLATANGAVEYLQHLSEYTAESASGQPS